MQWTQFFHRFWLLALSICWLTVGVFSQSPDLSPRHRSLLKTPPGLVYVSQKIDLRQQLSADETVYSLDGEPIPQLQTTSVTLGLLLDQEGHIVTRLANVPSPGSPSQLFVYPAGTRAGQFQAQLIGMDSVTGFCVLKIDNLPPEYTSSIASMASTSIASAAQRTVQIFGFNPRQRGNGAPNVLLVRPRIHFSTGIIKKASDDFRYSASNPFYYLLAPTVLTPIQDCSVAVEKDGSIAGLIAYDTSGEEVHLVYPLSRIQQLTSMIIAHKRTVVPHAWLGATSGAHDPGALVQRRLTEAERGVLIAAVFPDSPAEMAGIRPNDMLVSISGRTLTTGADLSSTLRLLPADSQVTLKVRRGKEFKLLPARLAPAPALDAKQQINWIMNQMEDYERRAKLLPEDDPNRAKNESKAAAMLSILGSVRNAAPPEIWLRLMYKVEVTTLTPQLARHFSAPGGVLIASLPASSKLAQAGVKVGDVMVKVGEQVVADAGSLMQSLSKEQNDLMEILVIRQGKTLTLKATK
jgi:S1-C subfamily serine protease